MTFPESTEFNKKIPKQQFYDNLDISKAVKEMFVEQIKAVYWQNKLSSITINLDDSKKIKEIEIFRIELNTENLNESVIKIIDKGIPYNIIFILCFEGKQKLCCALKEINEKGECTLVSKYYYTDWCDDITLDIIGLSLDIVYENFIRQIAGESILYNTCDLKDDILKSEVTFKLQKEIARLEKQARSEKQPKKKFELAEQVKKLKKQISEI